MIHKEDYIENIPNRNINLFTSITLLLFLMAIGGLLIIKQPDVIPGNIKLIAQNQPSELLVPSTGKLILLHNTNDTICALQDIAYIANPADYQTIKSLMYILNERKYTRIYEKLCNNEFTKQLGVLSPPCMELRSSVYQYNMMFSRNTFEESKKQIKVEIKTLEQQIEIKKRHLKIELETNKLIASNFIKDSTLFKQGAITKSSFDQSYSKKLAQKDKILEAENTLLVCNREIASKKLNLLELSLEHTNNLKTLEQQVEKNISKLQNEINIWRKQFVITAPVSGQLEVITSIENKQIVKQNTPVIRILPINNDIIGQVIFSSHKAGVINNKSNIKVYLDNYSEAQDGYLIGCISSISSSVYTITDGQSVYTAKAHIDFTKQKNFHGNFKFTHGMTGRAEIIVRRKNLLMQILNTISANI